MVLRPEYGDMYKFVVSLGLASVVGAAAAPWLLQSSASSDLYLSQDEFDRLTPAAQQVVERRLAWLDVVSRLTPYLSAGLLMFGAVLLLFGLRLWAKQQSVADDRHLAELQKMRLEIRSLTPAELERKKHDDANEQLLDMLEQAAIAGKISETADPVLPSGAAVHQAVSEAQVAQVDVVSRLKASAPASYSVRNSVCVGRSLEVDAVVEPMGAEGRTLLVEVRYFRAGAGFTAGLDRALGQLAGLASTFPQDTAAILLVIVLGDEARMSTAAEERLRNAIEILPTPTRVEVVRLADLPEHYFDLAPLLHI